MMKLGLIAPIALVLATSTVFAMPRTRRVSVSSAVAVDVDSKGSEVAADGEVRRMLAFARAAVGTPKAVTKPLMTCDVVELAQGNGMVRRCEVSK